MENFSYGRNQPKGTEFGKPAEPRKPVDADSFMSALDAYLDDSNEQTRAELRECVETILLRIDGA